MTQDTEALPATNRVTLSPVMDRNAVSQHLEELRKAFAGTDPIEIACEEVQQIGQAGLQLLLSAVRTGRERGVTVMFTGTGAIEPAIQLSATAELFNATGAAATGADQ